MAGDRFTAMAIKMNRFVLKQITHAMWFLPAVFSLFAILVVAVAYFSVYIFPASLNADELPVTVSTNAVRSILTIVASSMLAVTVFSLSTMVNLISVVSQSTSPRAVQLLVSDRTAQTSISIFIGAFLFSIVAIIGLSGEIYSVGGRLILFIATSMVVAAVVWALIRWIGHISTIGRVGETIQRVEKATATALEKFGKQGLYGCNRATGQPGFASHVRAEIVGFVQHFDRELLQQLAEKKELEFHILVRPGSYVDHRTPLLGICTPVAEECCSEIRKAFTLGVERTFEVDPDFGLTVLSEIGIKALSQAINDPGTAAQVATSQTRVLAGWAISHRGKIEDPQYTRLFIRPHSIACMLAASVGRLVFESNSAEVNRALLRGLNTLAMTSPNEFGETALKLAREIEHK